MILQNSARHVLNYVFIYYVFFFETQILPSFQEKKSPVRRSTHTIHGVRKRTPGRPLRPTIREQIQAAVAARDKQGKGPPKVTPGQKT